MSTEMEEGFGSYPHNMPVSPATPSIPIGLKIVSENSVDFPAVLVIAGRNVP
jgi:hypothetical protein